MTSSDQTTLKKGICLRTAKPPNPKGHLGRRVMSFTWGPGDPREGKEGDWWARLTIMRSCELTHRRPSLGTTTGWRLGLALEQEGGLGCGGYGMGRQVWRS